jgi:cyclic pyranopterin phosphate synthase
MWDNRYLESLTVSQPIIRRKKGGEGSGMGRLTHTGERGEARMVNVSDKKNTVRRAVARGRVRFGGEAFRLLKENRLRKGDALGVARLAGLQAGKRTSEWIPLCHQVPLDHLEVTVELEDEECQAVVTGTAEARWSTGVEMEAMVAVGAACLTLYDMTKSVDRSTRITGIELMEKCGGKSGAWHRKGDRT